MNVTSLFFPLAKVTINKSNPQLTGFFKLDFSDLTTSFTLSWKASLLHLGQQYQTPTPAITLTASSQFFWPTFFSLLSSLYILLPKVGLLLIFLGLTPSCHMDLTLSPPRQASVIT